MRNEPLWAVADPRDEAFATAAFMGTWSDDDEGLCPECTASPEERVSPLILEWQAGSDRIGDFIWQDMADQGAITADAAEKLRGRVGGFELGPVEMVQPKRLKRPARPNRRSRPRVWLPYEGPPIFELIVNHLVHVDLPRSSLRLTRKCGTCGRDDYELDGVEHREVLWSPERGDGVIMRHPRQKGRGLFVRRRDVPGAMLFRVHEWSGWILCTDKARYAIEDLQLTNIGFREVGELF